MGKMTLRLHNALKSTLKELASTCPNGVLTFGANNLTQETFCKPIDLIKHAKRMLECTRIEIKGLGAYPIIEESFVAWFKAHIRTPVSDYCSLVSAHNWLRYNIGPNLSCMKLSIGKVDYYLILREEWLAHFRQIAFKY